MKKYILLFLLLMISFLTYGQVIHNNERIINYHSDLQIDSTGRLLVTEHIKVYTTGEIIKRGLVRTIPMVRKDAKGNMKNVDVNVLEVLRDGKKEKTFITIRNEYITIYTGSEDYILPTGEYEYTIIYESYGHVGFFDKYDEIYWNVTGDEWNFIIQNASATVHLPQGASYINTACYTGQIGSTAKDCSCQAENDSTVKFVCKNELNYNEGFTIAVSFTRDIVKRPPPPTKAQLFREKYGDIICSSVGLLIIAVFYLLTWNRVGRDPKKKVIIPNFNPPNGWSPAVVRYIYKKKFEDKTITACILSMAVKGAINIGQDKNKYVLFRTDKTDKLSSDEKTAYRALFGVKKNLIEVNNSNYKTFENVKNKLHSKMDTNWNIKEYFRKNTKYIVWAALLNIIVLILCMVFGVNWSYEAILFMLPFTFMGMLMISLGLKNKNTIAKIFMMFIGISFTLSGICTGIASYDSTNYASILFILLLFAGFFFYIYIIKAPTEKGSEAQADLEGFKMYLETAEENRLNIMMPPEHTPELFEQMLPYAVALDVENNWSEKFSKVLTQANYIPEWYSGNLSKFTYANFANSLSSSFTSSFSDASVNQNLSSSSGSSSWSSGSGGSGSSGGGGGGGGGGGW